MRKALPKYDYGWWRKHLADCEAQADGSLMGLCPAHADGTVSLHIGPGKRDDGSPLVNCFAGCDYASIIAAANDLGNGTGGDLRVVARAPEKPVVQPADARRDPKGWLARKTGAAPEFLDTLPILFEAGVIRHHYGDPNGVTQDRVAGTKERRQTPAGAPCPVVWPLDDAMPEEAIFTEGQTDCVALRFLFRDTGIGVYAFAGATHLPSEEEWKQMHRRGLRLAVIAFDADEAGRKGAKNAIEAAVTVGIDVRMVVPPGYDALAHTGKDWCEWIAAGGTLDTFPTPNVTRALVTIAELAALMPTEYDWIVDPLIFPSGVTLIAGLPKSGKTTFVAGLAGDLGRGQMPLLPVVRVPSMATRVPAVRTIWLSEEPGPPLMDKHRGFGLREDTVYYTDSLMAERSETRTDVLLKAREQAIRWISEGTRVLIVVDSFEVWTGVENENDAAEVTEAVRHLRAMLAGTGAALILIHHLRKGGGERGEGIRGSGALVGSCDLVVEYGATNGDDERERAVNVRGRLDRGRSEQFMRVRLGEETHRFALLSAGDGTTVINPKESPMAKVGDENRDKVLAALPATVPELVASLPFAVRTIKGHLADLRKAGLASPIDVPGQQAPRWERCSGVQAGETT